MLLAFVEELADVGGWWWRSLRPALDDYGKRHDRQPRGWSGDVGRHATEFVACPSTKTRNRLRRRADRRESSPHYAFNLERDLTRLPRPSSHHPGLLVTPTAPTNGLAAPLRGQLRSSSPQMPAGRAAVRGRRARPADVRWRAARPRCRGPPRRLPAGPPREPGQSRRRAPNRMTPAGERHGPCLREPPLGRFVATEPHRRFGIEHRSGDFDSLCLHREAPVDFCCTADAR